MAEVMAMSNSFRHEPLDLTSSAIRVFTILPGSGTIRCSLKHVDLDSDRTACSYVWGDPEPSQVILINEEPFHIRKNLHDFLLQMRKDEFLKPLWVDAICIDQSNTSERNHQVQQMGSIYRGARAVVSWLGQGEPSVAQFMQFARTVSKEVTEKRAARLGTTQNADSAVLFYLSVHRHRWVVAQFSDSVTAFCCLEYFTRTWIVPEVFLAPAFHTAFYGDVSVAWVDLKHTLLTCFKILHKDELYGSPVAAFVQTPISYPHAPDCSSVFALIAKFSNTGCSDHRDHVFALYSLWDSGRFPIRVDYSLSCFALFLKLASWLLAPAIQPMSSFITLIDALGLEPENFANLGEHLGAEESIPITLSAAWSREIDMRELSRYRAMRLKAGKYKWPGLTSAHDFHFCTCGHCIQLHDLPETTVFREYVLRSRDHDRTTRERMDEEIYLVEIKGSKTYWGIVEGDLGDSDKFLVITPACLNRVSEPPRIDDRDGKLAISLSLRCLCELFNQLRPDEVWDHKTRSFHREPHWGIDCNKHDYIHNEDDASFGRPSVRGRTLWGRGKWRDEMRRQRSDPAVLLAKLLLEEQRRGTLDETTDASAMWRLANQLASAARIKVPDGEANFQDSLRN